MKSKHRKATAGKRARKREAMGRPSKSKYGRKHRLQARGHFERTSPFRDSEPATTLDLLPTVRD